MSTVAHRPGSRSGAPCGMTKTEIVCLAGALALVMGSAFAEKAHAEKDAEVRQDRKEVKQDRRTVKADRHAVRQDRHDVRNAAHRDDAKGEAVARNDLNKSEAKLHRDQKELRKDTQELRDDKRQLRQ